MAAVKVTLDGVLYDLLNRTTQRVVFVGRGWQTDLEVGGGPIIPPEIPDVPPIDPPVLPPVEGEKPPPAEGGWGYYPAQGFGWGYFPGSTLPAPKDPASDKPPPADEPGWGWVASWSMWGYFPNAGGKPSPIPPFPPIEIPPDVPTPVPPNSVIKAAPEGGWGLNSDANGGIYWVFNPAKTPKR